MERPVYLDQAEITAMVHTALKEDLGGQIDSQNDVTAALIPASAEASAIIITREDMIACGVEWVNTTLDTIDSSIEREWHVQDGDSVPANTKLLSLSGNARAILTAERTALNFLQMLSATATQTAKYASVLSDSPTQLLDTRKTIPGFRNAQKYAVLCGGGKNHRVGLYDAFLIKENHIAACGGIEHAVSAARLAHPNKPVEVEVESLDELQQALSANADIVMLDNFSIDLIHEAVALNKGQCKLEVSGNITDKDLQLLAASGVDYVSSGALTKHINAIDLSLRLTMK